MGLLDWLRRKPTERAAAPTIPTVPEHSTQFGPGAGHQPQHDILLRENLGIADAATRAIANRMASLQTQVVTDRRVADGTTETEILDDHPLKALLDRPHPNHTYRTIMYLTAQWIVATGEAYLAKVGNGFGVPTELHPIPPTLIEPRVRGGVVQDYLVTDANGEQYPRPADTIIRIYFPDPENPWRSQGYLGPSSITLDAYKFAGEHLRKFYQHDASPKVVLEGDKDAPPAPVTGSAQYRQFVEQWIQTYAGRHRGGEGGVPRFLIPGYRAHELQGGVSDSTRLVQEFWRDELLMAFGVPRSVLGQVVSGDRSSAETNQWVFDMYAVQPIALLVADALSLQLARDFEGDVRVEFAPFISEDKEFELRREQHDLEHAVRNINRVLTDRQEDTVPWGDKPTVLSKVKAYDPDKPDPAPLAAVPDPDEDDEEQDPERKIRALHIELRKLERELKRKKRGRAA